LRQKEGAMERRRGTVGQSVRRILNMAAVLLLAFVAVGCDQFTGGGWLRSAEQFENPMTTEKANFAANGKCREIQLEAAEVPGAEGTGLIQVAALYDGQFQYDDHALNVKFHGDTEPSLFFINEFNTCRAVHGLSDGEFVGVAEFRGNYRPQPKGAPGEFTGTISDAGTQGFVGDTFTINLQGGQYNGYTNAGPIEGGNIDVK